MEIKNVKINKPEDVNMILGQSHFIKTVEDLYEAIVTTAPEMKFGLAFCESSGDCKIRFDGNDEELKKLAVDNIAQVACGHSFIIFIRKGFPVSILNSVKNVAEVCSVFAATANPVEVVVADNGTGRGILGVIDGFKPKAVEDANDMKWRKDLLRKLGYKK